VAGVLAGCRVRLEDDAPPIPFIPPREPIPAEAALLWLLRDCRDLATAPVSAPPVGPESVGTETAGTGAETAGTEPAGTGTEATAPAPSPESTGEGTATDGTATDGAGTDGAATAETPEQEEPSEALYSREVYAEQVTVLRSALYRAGIPIETIDAAVTSPPETSPPPSTGSSPASTGSPTTDAADTAPASTGTPAAATDSPTTASPTTTPPTDPTAGDPAAALRRIDELRECGAGLFPLVVSVLAQRWAAVRAAGGEVPVSALVAEPEHTWSFPHLASAFVDLTRAAVYGMQIVAAQSRDEAREAAIGTLAAIEQLEHEQTVRAAGRVQSRPIGYALPFPVNSEQSAARLATHVLGNLIDGYGGLLTTVTGSSQADTARDVIAWIGTAAHLAAPWGVPGTAFPGLQSAN